MDERTRYHSLVQLIYEAALAPMRWAEALRALAGEVRSNAFHLQAWDRIAEFDRLGIVSTGQEHALAAYQGYYGRIDPRRQAAANAPVGSLLACHHHLGEDFVRGSEFFQEYLIPHGGRYTASVPLARFDGIDLQLDLVRSLGGEPFSDTDLELLGHFSPHVQRACSIMLRLHVAHAQQQVARSMLDVSNLGVLALSACGRIIQANSRGDCCVQSEIWLKQINGRIHAVDAERDGLLYAALGKAAGCRAPRNIDLGQSLGKGRCCVTLITPEDLLMARGSGAAVLCLVAESGRCRVATVYQLIDLFALSPAEARLTRALAQGESLDAFADSQGVKCTTARTQLQGALRKTGMDNQKDLIRLTLSLPAVR